MDCIFCKIINKEIPAEKVYEDNNLLAFLDIKPKSPGHTLLIPKKHFSNVYETPDEELEKIILGTKKLSLAIKNAVSADGINISINNGKAAGQIIFHTHVHIIPRFENEKTENSEIEIKEVAEKIKNSLA